MIEMKTNELEGKALDWAVAMAEGAKPERPHDGQVSFGSAHLLCGSDQERGFHAPFYSPSTNWNQGGSLIEPNRISLMLRHDGWWIACVYNINDEAEYMQLSDCPLEAAMRCLVASKLGDTVQVPKELLS
jgi:hypothetical protein